MKEKALSVLSEYDTIQKLAAKTFFLQKWVLLNDVNYWIT